MSTHVVLAERLGFVRVVRESLTDLRRRHVLLLLELVALLQNHREQNHSLFVKWVMHCNKSWRLGALTQTEPKAENVSGPAPETYWPGWPRAQKEVNYREL